MWRKLALTTVILLGGIGAPTQATNLLTNGGFESGDLAPWTVLNGSPVVTNVEAHTGNYSVSGFSLDGIQQTFAPTPTSQITEVSFWALREGGPLDFYTFLYDDGSTSGDFANALGTSGWQFFDLTSQLLPGRNLSGFQIYGTTPGPGFMDDFLINVSSAVPEPATWGMMVLGFGAVGLTMRRRKRTELKFRRAA